MSTKTQLTQALKEALKAGDNVQKTTLRLALAAIKNAEIQRGGELDEPSVLSILQKEVKFRRETTEEARRANRFDLETVGQAEIAVLQAHLPQPLSMEVLAQMVQEAISETGATSPCEMGNVMKVLMPRVKGRADGKQVSNLVRRSLQG